MGALWVHTENGTVVETIDFSPVDRYHPDYEWIDVSELDPQPAYGWSYADGVFSPPVVHVPTPEDIYARNMVVRNELLDIATREINPLQDAVDLDEATAAETALLKKWKQYRVAVNRINLYDESPAWPDRPA